MLLLPIELLVDTSTKFIEVSNNLLGSCKDGPTSQTVQSLYLLKDQCSMLLLPILQLVDTSTKFRNIEQSAWKLPKRTYNFWSRLDWAFKLDWAFLQCPSLLMCYFIEVVANSKAAPSWLVNHGLGVSCTVTFQDNLLSLWWPQVHTTDILYLDNRATPSLMY
jgi:hypothetical protein